ncbi:MAG: hypothetical protein ACFWTJ_14985 [Lachnoclostridium sp.]|jgi:phage-related protein|nr:phage-related protein [Defluviitalea raffinosedens]
MCASEKVQNDDHNAYMTYPASISFERKLNLHQFININLIQKKGFRLWTENTAHKVKSLF